MTTLVALIAVPFVLVSALLIIGEFFGKKKTWNF